MNGGTCNSQLGKEGYNCTCVAGYGGKNCSNSKLKSKCSAVGKMSDCQPGGRGFNARPGLY